MVEKTNKFLFIHIPKCAGTSLEVALGHYPRNKKLIRNVQDHRMIIHFVPLSFKDIPILIKPHNIPLLLKRLKRRIFKSEYLRNNLNLNRDEFKDFFKFSVVRNPYTRTISIYQNVIRDKVHLRRLGVKSLSFKEYVLNHMKNDPLATPMYTYLRDFNGKIKVDFIAKFETLENDVMAIENKIGLTIDLPHYLPSKNFNRIVDIYCPETLKAVEQFYKKDFEYFDYETLTSDDK